MWPKSAFILNLILKVPNGSRGLNQQFVFICVGLGHRFYLFKKEITKSAEKQGLDFKDISKDITKEIDKVKEDVDEITGPIKRNL